MKSHHSSIVKGLCSCLKVAHVPQKQTALVIKFYFISSVLYLGNFDQRGRERRIVVTV